MSRDSITNAVDLYTPNIQYLKEVTCHKHKLFFRVILPVIIVVTATVGIERAITYFISKVSW